MSNVGRIAWACSIILFGGISVRSILDDPGWAGVPRNLDAVELWSGAGAFQQAIARRGLQCSPFDINRIPGVTDVPGPGSEDLSTVQGFKKALTIVLRIKMGGILGMAPDCRSWIFPNSSNTKRKINNLAGDLSYDAVVLGNLLANIAIFLMPIALSRGVHFFLENPASSLLFRFAQDDDTPDPQQWQALHGTHKETQTLPGLALTATAQRQLTMA
jgi:hypothetical protein